MASLISLSRVSESPKTLPFVTADFRSSSQACLTALLVSSLVIAAANCLTALLVPRAVVGRVGGRGEKCGGADSASLADRDGGRWVQPLIRGSH